MDPPPESGGGHRRLAADPRLSSTALPSQGPGLSVLHPSSWRFAIVPGDATGGQRFTSRLTKDAARHGTAHPYPRPRPTGGATTLTPLPTTSDVLTRIVVGEKVAACSKSP